MPFSVRTADAAVVVVLRGALLDAVDGPALDDTLDAMVEDGVHHVVVDCARVTQMDTGIIGVLVGRWVSLRAHGGDLRLAAVPRPVRTAFLFTGLLDHHLATYPTLDDALASFDDGGTP